MNKIIYLLAAVGIVHLVIDVLGGILIYYCMKNAKD